MGRELELIFSEKHIGLDTETTGLELFNGDNILGLSLYGGTTGIYIDRREDLVAFTKAAALLSNFQGTLFIHNAKFDIHSLATMGIKLHPQVRIHCTEANERLVDNQRMAYSLDALAPLVDEKKDDVVKEYLDSMNLWEWTKKPGSKTRSKNYFFDKVPFQLMRKYAIQDAKITYKLGMYQGSHLQHLNKIKGDHVAHDYLAPLIRERRVTKVLSEMEAVGIKIDRDYCKQALVYEEEEAAIAMDRLEKLCGEQFVDSNKFLAKIFSKQGYVPKKTLKGNPTFTSDVLEEMDNPIALYVLKYRNAKKRSSTYYENFLWLSDADDVIHCNFKQCGAATGRMSCTNPNLQNLTKEEEASVPYKVRSSFIPREGYYFASIDYDQMEYRMMLEYAKETGVIEQILQGVDVHQATANMMGVDRKTAKTINFALLYGAGVAKLAKQLGVDELKAKDLKDTYFQKLPRVSLFIRETINQAKTKKFIVNWAGRRYQFPDSNFAYKAPNYLIQGGCAEVVKEGMIRVHEFLKEKKSRILVQVHDEVLLEVHESEAGIEEECKKLLENCFPYKLLPLTCGLDVYKKAWLVN